MKALLPSPFYFPGLLLHRHGLADQALALRVEYRAIVDAGFVLQLDDPGLPDTWDMLDPHPTVQEYKHYAMLRVDALNHALEGIPEDRVRYHICWGSWHGPHTTDIPLRDIVDVMLRVRAEAYSVEAGNVRHEHEYKLWREVKLPDGKILIPGVVSHATNVVEHPELVADRILAYANVVGRDNVIAGTDCGLGGAVELQDEACPVHGLILVFHYIRQNFEIFLRGQHSCRPDSPSPVPGQLRRPPSS